MSELIRSPQPINQLPTYSQIADPLAWCEKIGQSLAVTYGLNSPHHGTIMALTCLTENLSISKYHQRYHGDGTMRATAIQAEFQNRGGKIEWVNLGDDGKEARAKFSHPTHQPTPIEVRYSIEDAKRQVGEKMIKDGSNWKTNPGAMLRAALIRKAVKIIDPGIVAGYDDFSDVDDQPAPQPTTNQLQSRQAELNAMANEPSSSTATEEIIDAVVEEKPTATQTEAPPFSSGETSQPAQKCSNDELQELVALASKVPSPSDNSRGMNIQEIAEGVRQACNVTEPADATSQQIQSLIARFRQQLGQS